MSIIFEIFVFKTAVFLGELNHEIFELKRVGSLSVCERVPPRPAPACHARPLPATPRPDPSLSVCHECVTTRARRLTVFPLPNLPATPSAEGAEGGGGGARRVVTQGSEVRSARGGRGGGIGEAVDARQ